MEKTEKMDRSHAVGRSSLRRRARSGLAVAMVVAAVVGGGAVALATPGSGVSAPFMTTGTFPDGLDVKFKVAGHHGMAVSAVKGPGKAVVQQLIVQPGGHTGWHSHDGPVVVVVQAGALTLYNGDDSSCHGHTYMAGQAFVDPGQGHVHIARNEGSTPVEAWVTYLLPADGQPRVDQPDPGRCNPDV